MTTLERKQMARALNRAKIRLYEIGHNNEKLGYFEIKKLLEHIGFYVPWPGPPSPAPHIEWMGVSSREYGKEEGE